ncbi:ImmA/IrrE family metallo-endopeptidase [Macrococcus brunensis]|uniref:ImmA/IrrE family metallo-endopeptidase n=1 Tax=Macrococcus brunensis TaxID=198483 RepID=UPI001EEFB957|nr:ImmA/IrrE family metallo-endopeptidase [Macrococcus brunensis]ULG72971.1 ImmA/IrrE family metallo-endopeptidase [Macrococcus brunensis]
MRIEEKVNEVTAYIIERSEDLSIESLAFIYNIMIGFSRDASAYIRVRNRDVIFIQYGTEQQMWHSFAHELGHYFLHSSYHADISRSYSQMQEAEADKFALLFMMPERLIVEYQLFEVQQIMNYFRVTEEMATKRIEMLINRSRSHKLIGIEKY